MLMRNVLLITGIFILLTCRFANILAENEDVSIKESINIPSSPFNICPLLVGEAVPKLALRTVDGDLFDLNEAIKEKPAILIFYRGGWCPFCNIHLGQLQEIVPSLSKLGYQIIAISPDRPSKLLHSIKKIKPKYTLLSDSKVTGARAFGICFRVDEKTLEKYKGYGIDLEDASGEKHNLLPVPSAFVVGQDGIIKFAYVNPDYKVRVDPEVLLVAAKTALKKGNGK